MMNDDKIWQMMINMMINMIMMINMMIKINDHKEYNKNNNNK